MVQEPFGWWLLPIVLPLALAWFLSFTARRLDRLHHRVDATRAALDEQLARRARAAAELAGHLDDGQLAAAATAVLSAGGAGRAREQSESRLTQALRELRPMPPDSSGLPDDPQVGALLAEVRHAGQMVRLARRFHNDAVAQAQRVRRKRVVRWARLAGHAPAPRMVELDDADDLEAPAWAVE